MIEIQPCLLIVSIPDCKDTLKNQVPCRPIKGGQVLCEWCSLNMQNGFSRVFDFVLEF